MKCRTEYGAMIVATLLLIAGFAYHTNAQDNPKADTDQAQSTNHDEIAQKPDMMQCPMMAAMKDIEMFADSPPVLLGQVQKLALTEKQVQQMREIGESARKRALEVLNVKQRELVAKAPDGPLSMMELAKLQKKDAGSGEEPSDMCPMCMKMMHMQTKTIAHAADAKPATEKPQVHVNVLRQDKYEGKMDGADTTATMVEVTLDPLAGSRPHRHPGPVSGYIIEGTYEFQVEGGSIQTLNAGDTFFEPAMILHKVSRNPDKEKPTRVLATIVHPSDAKLITIPEPSDQQSR